MEEQKRFVLLLLTLVIIILASCALLHTVMKISGSSMEPNFPDGSGLVITDIDPNDIKRGDIILYQLPQLPDNEYINRVVGLPSEIVEIDNGQILIDRELRSEPYPTFPPNYSGEWVIEENQLFVLGDNRPNSFDSHLSGPIMFEYVVGIAKLD